MSIERLTRFDAKPPTQSFEAARAFAREMRLKQCVLKKECDSDDPSLEVDQKDSNEQ